MRRCFNWGEDEERGGKKVRIKESKRLGRGVDAGGAAWWVVVRETSLVFNWFSCGRHRFVLAAFLLSGDMPLERELPCISS